MAKLYFRYGVMGSGKTRDLMKVYYNYENKNMHALIMKPLLDTKEGSNIGSRDGNTMASNYLLGPKDNPYLLLKKIQKEQSIHCLLIDEAQFLKSKQVEQLTSIVDRLDIPVICYGLKIDFRTKLFEGSKRLMELADTIEEVKTACYCNRKAIMNIRMVDGTYIFKGTKIIIDNQSNIKYDGLCRKCYNALKNVKNK